MPYITDSSAWPKLLTVCAVLTLAPDTINAQIYKYTDENGNVVFSDKRPTNGAADTVEEVKLNSINSTQRPPDIPRYEDSRQREAKTEDAVSYQTVITSPPDGTTIPMGPGNFNVSARVEPSLGPDEQLLLKVDGSPAGEPQRSGLWALSNVFRGEHKLTVERIRDGKRIISTSPAVTVYVLRPSVR